MSCLDDANITRLLGVCFDDDPVCLVLEYHRFGDLKRFLRRHVVDSSMTQRSGVDTLRSARQNVVFFVCLITAAKEVF